jgi:hypothetical protein
MMAQNIKKYEAQAELTASKQTNTQQAARQTGAIDQRSAIPAISVQGIPINNTMSL